MSPTMQVDATSDPKKAYGRPAMAYAMPNPSAFTRKYMEQMQTMPVKNPRPVPSSRDSIAIVTQITAMSRNKTPRYTSTPRGQNRRFAPSRSTDFAFRSGLAWLLMTLSLPNTSDRLPIVFGPRAARRSPFFRPWPNRPKRCQRSP